MPTYHAPPESVLKARRNAAKLALADLSPESRQEIDAFMFRLTGIRNVGPDAALEIVAALAMSEERPR
jgi:hypothetical protein